MIYLFCKSRVDYVDSKPTAAIYRRIVCFVRTTTADTRAERYLCTIGLCGNVFQVDFHNVHERFFRRVKVSGSPVASNACIISLLLLFSYHACRVFVPMLRASQILQSQIHAYLVGVAWNLVAGGGSRVWPARLDMCQWGKNESDLIWRQSTVV